MSDTILSRLRAPQGVVDAVLDTDTFNEIDDQFALSYMLRSTERINTRAIYAAPFFNENSSSPEDGMLKSYEEIKTLLKLANREDLIPCAFEGSRRYLPDEKTPVDSPAARDLAARAAEYSPEHPLYVVGIGAITNVASALLLNPAIAENIVVVWLGGHSLEWPDTNEFNMMQDVAAAPGRASVSNASAESAPSSAAGTSRSGRKNHVPRAGRQSRKKSNRKFTAR